MMLPGEEGAVATFALLTIKIIGEQIGSQLVDRAVDHHRHRGGVGFGQQRVNLAAQIFIAAASLLEI